MEPCDIATEFLGAKSFEPCPALELNQQTGGSACGMIIRPLHYLLADGLKRLGADSNDPHLEDAHRTISQQVALTLGAGRGCDTVDDEQSASWPWIVKLTRKDNKCP